VEERDTPISRELFDANLSLVDQIARQVIRCVDNRLDFNELRSFGLEGLMVAARRFDPEKGVPFRGYAAFRVRGAMIDGVRKNGALPRRTHQKLKALQAATQFAEDSAEERASQPPPGQTRNDAQNALDDYLARVATAMAVGLLSATARGEDGLTTNVSPAEPADEALANAQVLRLVHSEIEKLPHEERELIQRHYFNGERFDHVAEDLGLSKSWASRQHTRAVGRLAQHFRQLDVPKVP
jgi:RNA polymerase sigma factor for flagellar operon FliA